MRDFVNFVVDELLKASRRSRQKNAIQMNPEYQTNARPATQKPKEVSGEMIRAVRQAGCGTGSKPAARGPRSRVVMQCCQGEMRVISRRRQF
jgi:hypothetical protein